MLNIDSRNSKPIYEQIVDGIKEDIIKKILNPGDKLPSVREMSTLITANPNTVSRAYMELERQKVIETIRGKGTYVSACYEPRLDDEKMNKLKSDLKKIIVEAYYMGIGKDEMMNVLNELYESIKKDGGKD